MSSPGQSQVQLQPPKGPGAVEKDPQGLATSDDGPDPGEHLEGARMYSVTAALLTAIFLGTLDASILATAIPQITARFHSTLDIGWYASIYMMATCAILPMAGMFYSYFSAKYTFMGFLFVFELGSLLSAAAVSSKMLIVGRAIAGLGSAGIYNGGLTIMGERDEAIDPGLANWTRDLGGDHGIGVWPSDRRCFDIAGLVALV
ncbi:MFS general substrate transporter [Aspergillus steynii IBT 23096]|uniref:MFS general substrate transporter n=1 Tax=Aspergillus steynii IBT 23096 TaxID=1392250 RepID=A0A2I2G0F1_9EURO|nr:MFS general substrate transporter [Aspergillus steynii IBT 23096]PLB46350.1 MFS general substrate transporter [Aspergillus steynii IBT 23096]